MADLLRPDWTALLFQIFNFVILLVALNFFLFRPLRSKLKERSRVIAETLQSARDQEAEAAQLRERWERRWNMIEEQAEEIRQNAQAEAAKIAESILEEARARLDHLTEQMREDLRQHREELVLQHYEGILDTIIDLSGSVVQSVTTRRTHDDLVTNFMASIYQLPQEEVNEYRRLMAGRLPVAFVTTPVPLTPEQAQSLTDTLSSLIDHKLQLQVQIEPRLIAGIRVRLADKLMDNSLQQQLGRIRARVRTELITRMGETT
jgi:F-type H+-transporting ATPase subunit b